MDYMNIPLFDEDFYKMAFLFFINFFFLTIIIRWFYYGFTLKKYKLDIGLAIGLFAIFGIIRYRTESIPIKEMTYLFIVIGVSLMNAFVNKKMSYAEVVFANAAIVFTIGIIERGWNLNYEVTKEIVYENIENIKPENYELLKSDIKK